MSGTSPNSRADRDWYVEPGWASELLLRAHAPDDGQPIWDPAAGQGTIVDSARKLGLTAAYGTDLEPQRNDIDRFDFLAGFSNPPASMRIHHYIVSNPPFKYSEAFIRQAIKIGAPRHAWFLRHEFPYSQRRHSLFAEHPPARLLFLSTRPSCPPGDMLRNGEIEAKGGAMDYLWMVWDRAHSGPTECGWLLRPKP